MSSSGLRVEAKERTSAPPAGSRAISRHNPGDQHAESALSDSPDVTHRAGNNSVDLQGVMSVDGPKADIPVGISDDRLGMGNIQFV